MTPKARAAKAVKNTPLGSLDWDHVLSEAALAAIAEPSEAMIDAMRALTIYDSTKEEVTALWKAAHAAMMAEKDGTK